MPGIESWLDAGEVKLEDPAEVWIREATLRMVVAWIAAPNTHGDWPVDRAITCATRIWDASKTIAEKAAEIEER